jgi:hypothetical protein
VAFWDSGSYLVCGCRAAMVAKRGSEMKSTATGNEPIACTLIEGDFRDRLAWIAEVTRDALRGYERADLTLKLRYARAAVPREFADSPVEEGGFELPVPRKGGRCEGVPWGPARTRTDSGAESGARSRRASRSARLRGRPS